MQTVPKNPLTDVWQFLTATTSDYLDLGGWRFLLLALFWGLFVASIALAIINLRDDPAQRNAHTVGLAVVRVLIGCMWFEGILWKLPLPASEGLRYWTEQEVTRAAFEFHRDFIKDVILPHIVFFGPFVFLAELTFAISLILGFAVRAVSVLAILFVAQLWLGIYRPGNPSEWPWSYMFLMLLMFVFALEGAGRCLGLDAWLRRSVKPVRDARGPIGRLLHIAS
jgi:uncharacterized membrane protein YphA (DoxX/SURF4 family)